jgi:hypothetical protein
MSLSSCKNVFDMLQHLLLQISKNVNSQIGLKHKLGFQSKLLTVTCSNEMLMSQLINLYDHNKDIIRYLMVALILERLLTCRDDLFHFDQKI